MSVADDGGREQRLTEHERIYEREQAPRVHSFAPVRRGVGEHRMHLYVHRCGHVEWIRDVDRAEVGGGCDGCESGSPNPSDWRVLYVSVPPEEATADG